MPASGQILPKAIKTHLFLEEIKLSISVYGINDNIAQWLSTMCCINGQISLDETTSLSSSRYSFLHSMFQLETNIRHSKA